MQSFVVTMSRWLDTLNLWSGCVTNWILMGIFSRELRCDISNLEVFVHAEYFFYSGNYIKFLKQ